MPDLIEPHSQNDLLALAVQTYDELLPDGWETSLLAATDDPYIDRRQTPDALLEVVAPDGSTTGFAIIARLTLAGREADAATGLLRRWSESNGTESLIVSRYLSTTAREFALDGRASFLDATGNVHVACARPAMAIMRPGLDRDPWRASLSRASLRGEPAARVIRALCEHQCPVETARLIERAGASVGAAYRVIDLLIDEGVATKGARGWVDEVDWSRALERWAHDQSLGARKGVQRFKLPDGVDPAFEALASPNSPATTIGGGHAASLHDRTDAGDAIYLHTPTPLDLARHLGAVASDHGDLWIDSRWPALAARGATKSGKLSYVTVAQAYADLSVNPDSGQRALTLLDWMRENEARWRSAD